MALKAVYERFLASPNPLSLADNASLHYVTTLTSFTQPGPIIKHLEYQGSKTVKTKSFKTIDAVQGATSIALEVDTTLEFIAGGGAYLPGVDNFIIDKIVTVPVTHIVHFDHNQKITQIRISWDQGSLLKQADIIGSRGRFWPVFDGKDQVKLIAHSLSTNTTTTTSNSKVTPPTSPRGRGNENGFPARDASPSKKFIKDPHASLNLFDPKKDEQNVSSAAPYQVAPRSLARPPSREMSDLFAAGHEDYDVQPNGSPKKSVAHDAVAPKSAGQRKFQGSRLFGEDEDTVKERKIYHTNPARYNHFDIGDPIENDAFQHEPNQKTERANVPMRAQTAKHGAQWDFADFATPAKPGNKVRGQDVVHISWNGNDKTNDTKDKKAAAQPRRDADRHFEIEDDGTPVNRQVQPKARKDAQTHFDFDDKPTPPARRIIARTEAAKGLYRNVLEEDGDDMPQSKPLATITNNKNKKSEFDSHWNMDQSPTTNPSNENKGRDTHKQAVQNLGSRWDSYDESPEPTRPVTKQYKKGLQSSWSFGDE